MTQYSMVTGRAESSLWQFLATGMSPSAQPGHPGDQVLRWLAGRRTSWTSVDRLHDPGDVYVLPDDAPSAVCPRALRAFATHRTIRARSETWEHRLVIWGAVPNEQSDECLGCHLAQLETRVLNHRPCRGGERSG
jgi:hypothetical protein